MFDRFAILDTLTPAESAIVRECGQAIAAIVQAHGLIAARDDRGALLDVAIAQYLRDSQPAGVAPTTASTTTASTPKEIQT